MPETLTKLTVFIASPGDLPENERAIVRDVCISVSRTPYFVSNKIQLKTIGWKTDVFAGITDEHPQIDLTKLAENADILIALFHKKLGGSGASTVSGSVDEIEAALKKRKETLFAPEIKIYFREVHDDSIDEELKEYKKKLHNRDCQPFIRTEDYGNALHLQERLFLALSNYIDEWLTKQNKEIVKHIDTKCISEEFQNPLFEWPQTIDGVWLNRKELDDIYQRIIDSIEENEKSNTATLLLGAPGTGKSSILARLGLTLRDEGLQVISVKADMVPASIKSQDDLSAHLKLPYKAEDCLRQMAITGPAVLIVDQLDAVSEIADRKSERLNLLLNFIKTASAIEGVHVVCSSRIFEHQHDSRLATLEAMVVTLQSPSWDESSKLLSKFDISLDTISDDLKELLSTPLHLKTFLEVIPHDQENLKTIHDLHEKLWEKKILAKNAPNTSISLVKKLANWMSEEEDLWAPIVLADEFHDAMTYLDSENILLVEGTRIGFRHQTFFDFVVAREYASGGKSLSQDVMERQDGLFVRPILLSTLDYLRATAKKSYHREITTLWNHTSLRKHMGILLDEKLASLPEPDETEQSLVFSCLQNNKVNSSRNVRLLVAMAGSPGWFKLIKASYLPDILSKSKDDAWPAINVMSAAWPFARNDVLDLLETYVLPFPEKDTLTSGIFQGVDKWDEKTVEILCIIARRSDNYNIKFITEDISQSQPDLATKIVRAVLEREIELANIKDSETAAPPPLTDEASEDEIAKHIVYQPHKSLENVIEAGNNWYELSAIAEEAPQSFINEIWPLLIREVHKLAYPPNPRINEYQASKISFPLEDTGYSAGQSEPIYAIKCAVVSLAQNDEEAFVSFFKENVSSQFGLVHRLLTKGLLHVAEAHPDIVLKYLTDDVKRLSIGNYEDKHAETKALISKVVPFLDKDGRKKIEQIILIYECYLYSEEREESPKDKQDRFKGNRQHRLRLLRAIPDKYASSEIKKFRKEEERAMPSTKDWDSHFSGVHTIGSRMSADQMLKAKNEHLLKLFVELDDLTGCDHPRLRWDHVGGTIQASRELEIFSEKAPERGLQLLEYFKPDKQEIAASHIIVGLAKSSLSSKELFSQILVLDKKDFKSDDFRVGASRALDLRAKNDKGLPDDILVLLEQWLFTHETPHLNEDIDEQGEDKEDSILWGMGSFINYGGGRVYIAEALTKGYLFKEPPDYKIWRRIFEKMAASEKHPKVWEITLPYAQYLFNDDKEKATQAFDKLFTNFSQICHLHGWIMCVAQVLRHVPDIALARKWLMGIKECKWSRSNQAFGELIMLYHCYSPEDEWGLEQMREALNNADDIGRQRGIAYAASNLWHYHEYNATSIKPLITLASSSDEITQRAIASICRYGDPLELNESMKQIIEAILHNDALLMKAAEAMIEGIEPSTGIEPDLVWRICQRFLEVGIDEVKNIGSSMALLAEVLVRISLTLHRMESHRKQGLELFEQLMESNIGAARQALHLLDRKPIGSHTPARRPRLRRPRKKRRTN